SRASPSRSGPAGSFHRTTHVRRVAVALLALGLGAPFAGGATAAGRCGGRLPRGRPPGCRRRWRSRPGAAASGSAPTAGGREARTYNAAHADDGGDAGDARRLGRVAARALRRDARAGGRALLDDLRARE